MIRSSPRPYPLPCSRGVSKKVFGSYPPATSYPPRMRPKILARRSSFHLEALEKCARLNSDYERPFFLLNGHIETIWASFLRKHLNLDLEREFLHMADGGVVTLDTLKTDEPIASDAPVLLLLPGLANGSSSNYVQYAIQSAQKAGFRAIAVNGRGMASSPVYTPQFYSASYTEDLRKVVHHLHDKFSDSHMCAVGWSLGANILVNYLGEEGKDATLLAAVSLCNPFDLAGCDENWKSGFSHLYSRNLAGAMKNQFREHVHLFEGYDMERAMAATTVREMDDVITRVTFGNGTFLICDRFYEYFSGEGWESVDAYYSGSSSSLRIPNVGIPLLCVQAEDDPICPAHCIPKKEIQENENCALVVTPYGGHLGWVSSEDGLFGAPWTDRVTLEWLTAILQQTTRKQSKSTKSIAESNGVMHSTPSY